MAARSTLKSIAAIGGAAFVASATYYGAVNYQRYQSIRYASGEQIRSTDRLLQRLPPVEISQHVQGPTKIGFNLTLFQYCSCPFCCKVRTFLDYYGVNYNIVEVNPVLRQQLKWSQNYRKVPILLAHTMPAYGQDAKQPVPEANGKILQINDSSVIISGLGSYLLSKHVFSEQRRERTIDDLEKIIDQYQPMIVDSDAKDKTAKAEIPNRYFLMLGDVDGKELKNRETDLAEERYWREWADNVLVHSLSPNIYRNMGESMQAFKNFSTMGNWEKHFSPMEHAVAVYAGSFAMYMIGKRLKKKYNLKDDVRESLYDNCRQWIKAIGKDRQFMGGDKPNLADLAVFGVLRSIEGCTAFDDLLSNTNIKPWFYAVKESCQSHSGSSQLT